VTISTHRADRPTDFATRLLPVEAEPARPCPFCPGNEEDGGASAVAYREDGTWSMRIVPNRYPAFEGSGPLAVHRLGPVHVQAEASGIHEVFVFSPDHDATFASLSDDDAGRFMTMLAGRMAEHAASRTVLYTQAVVNQGREAGASLAHPHGQLLGVPFVPGEIVDEERAFALFHGGCILCATAEVEHVVGTRVLFADDEVMVISPFWAGTPYELLVFPRRHDVHIQDSDEATLVRVGQRIRDTVAALTRLHGDVAYNLAFHTAPHHHDGLFHWHVHLWPKLVTVAGFETGTGVLINIVSPEDAAESLRAVVPATI
jgi:UDPglucose--hexose-1-phosphate uridylyltransferase